MEQSLLLAAFMETVLPVRELRKQRLSPCADRAAALPARRMFASLEQAGLHQGKPKTPLPAEAAAVAPPLAHPGPRMPLLC